MSEKAGQEITIPENVEATEPLKIYLKGDRTGSHFVREEERLLGQQCAQGDEDDKRKLEEGNLRLVVSIGKALYRARTFFSGSDPGREYRTHACCGKNMTIQKKTGFPRMLLVDKGSNHACAG